MKKVLFVVAPVGFRDEEAFGPKKVLEAAGHKVVVASKGTRKAKGKLGGELDVDMDIGEAKVEDYDAVVFVGGPGAETYFEDAAAHKIAREAVEKGKVLAAICIAPVILAKAGVLKGRRATTWDEGGEQIGILKGAGAEYSGEKVTVDGKLVTGTDPTAVPEFSKRIAELLS